MKVAVLWTKLSGYLNSCLHALAEIPGVELFVAYQESTSDAPFKQDQFQWLPTTYRYDGVPNEGELLASLKAFAPEVMIVASWHLSAYRAACRAFRGRSVRVCCMDNPWEATLRQWVGVASSPLFVRRLFEAAFVPGERQASFAKRLGFNEARIWRGSLSCDRKSFARLYESRKAAGVDLPRSFVCVGRLSPEKGYDTLIRGYSLYREQHHAPWPLLLAGEGPLRRQLEGVPGTKLLGFIQPDELPQTLSQGGCFLLPSNWEHWGVAIHEASAAGLPIICSSSCGAAVHLVQDGYNGFLMESRSAHSLARSLIRFTNLNDRERNAMGDASHFLSLQFTPERWARSVHDGGRDLLEEAFGRVAD